MNSEFMLSQGAGQKLEFAVKRCGGTQEDIEYLSTGENFRAVSLLRTGKARLVEVTETASGGAVIPTVPTLPTWTVDGDDNIHFTLTSNGFSPERWIRHLELRGWHVNDWARQVLRSASKASTNGVAYNIVVRPGRKIRGNDSTTEKICAAAEKNGWAKPHWEVACLIRDAFADKKLEEMGLWQIVTMHEPINDSDYNPCVLNSGRRGDGCWLSADHERSVGSRNNNGGFAFIIPQSRGK